MARDATAHAAVAAPRASEESQTEMNRRDKAADKLVTSARAFKEVLRILVVVVVVVVSLVSLVVSLAVISNARREVLASAQSPMPASCASAATTSDGFFSDEFFSQSVSTASWNRTRHDLSFCVVLACSFSFVKACSTKTARLHAAKTCPLTSGFRIVVAFAGSGIVLSIRFAAPKPLFSSPPPPPPLVVHASARASRFSLFLLGVVPSAPPSGPRFFASSIATPPSFKPCSNAAATKGASRPRPASFNDASASSMARFVPLPAWLF
mmetsp:Transcript_829/g.3203  ORF Transcript_829/g.3203 Transcript_829/m.3203 type:complete len:267 (+) Transcript_829:2573-3373(+)